MHFIALHANGIPWLDSWALLQTLSAEAGASLALAGSLLCALPLAWLIRQAALFTPETTLHFDKRARLLTISQKAPALRPRSITVPFDAVQGFSAERWTQGESSEGPQLWFLEIRCRDGRRFRTPATEHSPVLESCALRIRNGALTSRTVGESNPPRSYQSGVGRAWAWVVGISVFLFLLSKDDPFFGEPVLQPNGALAMARLQHKSSSDKGSVQIRYTFVLPSGRDIDASRSVFPHLAARWKEGDWMVVRYDRREPEQNQPVSAERVVQGVMVGNIFLMLSLVSWIGSDLIAASPGKPWDRWPRDGWY